MATLIDGKVAALALRTTLAAEVADMRARHGVQPGLAVVLVGENPASEIYVRNKAAQTTAVGMASIEHRLPATINAAELLALIGLLNADDSVDGILVQLPLPPHIPEALVINAIDPAKDVDGFHLINVGRLATGAPGLVPCTPQGCMLLLRATLGDLTGKAAVVVGRSNIVGKPMAQLLLAANCTVTIAHSRSQDLAAITAHADILVVAVGQPELIRASWIKPGAVVIDVGMNRIAAPGGKSRLVGDVDFDAALHVASAITPVPGGVGPMTIACLLRNTLIAAHQRRGLALPAGLAS